MVFPLPRITKDRPEVSSMGGGLEGAQRTSRETMLWSPPRLSADRLINGFKDEADFRGRDMVLNDGYAAGIVDINRDSIVGSQYRLNAQPNFTILQRIDPRFDETWAEEFQVVTEEIFNLTGESCWLHAGNTLTFANQVRLAIASFVFTGEVLATAEWIRKATRPFSTAIQIVSPARLSNPNGRSDDERLRRGIEHDEWGAPVRYWIRDSHPGDYYSNSSFSWTAVPAAKNLLPGAPPFWNRQMVIFIKDGLEPGQTRGIAGMVAALKEMKMTKKFRDITLQNAVINASYAATIESELPQDIIAAMMGQGADGQATYFDFIAQYLSAMGAYVGGGSSIAIDGAKMPILFPGTSFNVKALGTPGGIGTEYEVSMLRHIAAALGISYEEFARDFSKTNYSSARASMLTTWKHMMSRKAFVADRYASAVYALWLEEQWNARNLPMPANSNTSIFYEPWGKEALTQCGWIGAGRGQIDEMKETQASILRISSGLSTYEDEIALRGGDWRKVFRQRARENRFADSLDLVFSTNATKDGSQGGQTTMGDNDREDASQRSEAA